MYAFGCGNDSKNRLIGICISQSENIDFQEYKLCLDGIRYRKDFDKFLFRSINQ